jgi:hypothetical protein
MIPLLLLIAAAPGDPPTVRYAVKVVTKSWEPIVISEVEKILESHALPPLTKPGVMRLEKSGYAELGSGDYVLTLDGRFIEEAESFSVYMSFGKGKRSDVPSFHASDTAALGKLKRPEMQQRIESLVRSTAERLAELIAPRLERARLALPPAPLEEPALPWQWGPIEVPEPSSPSKTIRTLLDVREHDNDRAKALADLSGHVSDQPPAREAVLRCVLADPSPSLRARCVDALEAISRTHVPTQRVLLHALRSEIEPEVVRALAELSGHFVGLSRKESIETWLEVAASEATPGESAGAICERLGAEGDVANLDLALAKCLTQESLAYGKKSACAQWLLPKIPKERRLPVVLPYFEGLAVWEQGERNTYDDVIRSVTEGSGPLDPALAAVLLDLAVTPRTGRVRQDVLYHLERHPAPDASAAERLLVVVRDPQLATAAIRTLKNWAKKNPTLRAPIRGALERLSDEAPFLRAPHREDPREALKKAITELK